MENNIQKWYEMDMSLEEVKRILSANIKTMSRSFIAAGFYMKYIRDNELYKQDGYSNIWEFSQAVYGIQKSTASRWMAINDKFSKDGNSPVLDNRYKDFNKSQLQEMLYLTEQQIQDAVPEMSAKEIRAIRKPEIVAPAQQEDQIPGQDSIDQHPEYMPEKMTIETATGQNRPPEDRTEIPVETQIERFYEALNKNMKNYIIQEDKNMTIFMLSELYRSARVRNGHLNYQGSVECITFNPDGVFERKLTWADLAKNLIGKYGHKKPVKILPVDAPEELTATEAVKAFCEAYPEKLKTIMRICRQYDTNREAAKAVQEKMAPYGWNSHSGSDVDYTFMGFAAGLEITVKEETVKIKYSSFIVELKRLYDPYSPEFDEEERCFQAADQEENAAEKQQTDHFVEPNKIDHTGETTEMVPWPEELIDIQIPTETEITGYLYDEQRKLKEIEESRRPWMEVYRQQLIVAGLKLVKKLVENQE